MIQDVAMSLRMPRRERSTAKEHSIGSQQTAKDHGRQQRIIAEVHRISRQQRSTADSRASQQTAEETGASGGNAVLLSSQVRQRRRRAQVGVTRSYSQVKSSPTLSV